MVKLRPFCEKEFRPNQMGVGTLNGCEAAVHAVWAYVKNATITERKNTETLNMLSKIDIAIDFDVF